jgi:hypothetical protein
MTICLHSNAAVLGISNRVLVTDMCCLALPAAECLPALFRVLNFCGASTHSPEEQQGQQHVDIDASQSALLCGVGACDTRYRYVTVCTAVPVAPSCLCHVITRTS